MTPALNPSNDDPHPKGDRDLGGPVIEVCDETEAPALAWDAFLQRTSQGQFQQSSAWARYKANEGWRMHRVVFRGGDGVNGGFQLLWRRSRFGKIGYVTKGPVLNNESADHCQSMVECLRRSVRDLGLLAVIVQPPDESVELARTLSVGGFVYTGYPKVIRATLWIPVSEGMKALEQGMRRRSLQEVRQARRRGVKIRQGNDGDLAAFFRLMQASCLRQRTHPNPASEALLRAQWKAFGPEAKLWLASIEERDVAGIFCLRFGQRLTLWKKGWSEEFPKCHANRLVNYAAIQWASENEIEFVDFAGLNREIAETMLRGTISFEEVERTRDMFNLGFGGRPKLLPDAVIYSPHRTVRWMIRCLALVRRSSARGGSLR